MITGKLKSDIDKLWEEFWTGGITNPLTVIEQISFLMFARLLDVTETRNEKRAERTKKPFSPIFGPSQQKLRWSKFRHEPAEKMLALVLLETIAVLEDRREQQLSQIADAVHSAAKRTKNASIKAPFEKTLAYRGQSAQKGVKTRAANKAARTAATPASPAAASPPPPSS